MLRSLERPASAGYMLMALLLSAPALLPAAIVTSIADGPWSDNATWDSGAPPSTGDDVVVLHNVALSQPSSVADLSLQAGTLAHDASTLTVTGDFSLAGGAYTAAAGTTVSFAGSAMQTISGGPTFQLMSVDNTAASPDDLNAVLSTGGLRTLLQVNIQEGQFTPADTDVFRNISIFSGGILKPVAGATITVDGSSGTDSFRLNAGGLMDPNGGTFRFTSPTGGGIFGGSFHDLEVACPAATPDDSNHVRVGSTVANLLLVSDGQASLSSQVNDVTVGADGILKIWNSSASFSGDLTNTAGGAVIAASNTYPTFNGSGPQVIDGPATFEGLQIQNTAPAPDDANAVSTTGGLTTLLNINILDGQFTPTDTDVFRNISIHSGGILKPAPGATITVDGSDGSDSFRLNAGGLMDPNGGTFRFTSPAGGGVYGGFFHDLEVACPAATPDDSNHVRVGSNVANLLLVSDGQASLSSQVHDVIVETDGILKIWSSGAMFSGDLVNSVGGSVIAASSTYPFFNGTGPQVIDGPATFAGLQIQNTAPAPDDANAVSTTGGLTTLLNINILDGQFTPTTGDTFASVFIHSGGILKPAAGSTVTVNGVVGGDAFRAHSGSVFDPNGGTFRFESGGEQGVFGPTTFYNVDAINTAATPNDSNDVQIGGVDISNRLRVLDGQATITATVNHVEVASDGILKLATFSSPTIQGNLTNLGSVLASDASVTTFDGGPNQTLTSSSPIAFSNLTIAAGTVLDEDGSADSTATFVNLNGTLRRSHTVAGPGPLTGGLTGVDVDVTTQGTLTTLVIDRISTVPNAAAEHELDSSWTFNVAGASLYAVDLTFPHGIGNFADAAASRYLGSGTNWDFIRTSSTASTVTRAGVTDLSSVWAVAEHAGASVADWMLLTDR